MAVTRKIDLSIFVNGVNITSSVIRYLASINLEDIFDTSFTPSKLSLDIFSKCTVKWNYRDQIKLFLAWNTSPSDILETNVFYLDYIDDGKSNGSQTYTLNAIEADPNLGFNFGNTGEFIVTNKDVKTYLTEFSTTFGLTLTESVGTNVFIGTIPVPDNQNVTLPVPNSSSVNKKFNSRPEILQHICSTYGYFGNISGTKLQVFRLETGLSIESDFAVPDFDSIISLNVENKYSGIYKKYSSMYCRNPDRVLELFDKTNSFNINTKAIDFINEGAYFNVESATERAIGAMYLDYLEAFRCRLVSVGFSGYKAGKRFSLGESYGMYSGLYRCLKVYHRIDPNGWVSTIEAFPLDKIAEKNTSFQSTSLGTIVQVKDFEYSQILSSALPTALQGAWLDNFAKSLNPDYGNTGLGAIYITEGTTEGIRADIAFCQMLVETNNWRETTRISRKNPANIGNSAGTAMNTFSTWETGIRAHIQHLFAYSVPLSGAGTRTLVNGVVDPRFSAVTRGTAKTVTALTGNWSSSPSYAPSILEKMKALYIFLGNKNPTLI